MTDNVLELLQARSGPLFWASAFAMAAGGTALVIAPLLALRRWRRRRTGPARRPARPAPAAKAAAQAAGLRAYRAQAGGPSVTPAGSPAGAAAPAGGAPAVAPSGVEPGSAGLGAVRLAPLLARLRRAAADLEDYAARDEAVPPPEEMGLKALAGAVEYVHKAVR